MSSVIAFVRAAIMLGCLVAVPLLALTHAETLVRVRHAAARFVERFAGEGGAPESAVLEPVPLRSAVESGPAVEGQSAPRRHASPRLFPEPVDERDAHLVVLPVQIARPETLHVPEPAAPQSANAGLSQPDPRVKDWQDAAAVLQRLGAVEYALEKWGSSGELYRFHCLVAVTGAESYRRHFQAVDADGGRAVQRVLQDVRDWRGSPLPVQ